MYTQANDTLPYATHIAQHTTVRGSDEKVFPLLVLQTCTAWRTFPPNPAYWPRDGGRLGRATGGNVWNGATNGRSGQAYGLPAVDVGRSRVCIDPFHYHAIFRIRRRTKTYYVYNALQPPVCVHAPHVVRFYERRCYMYNRRWQR